MIRLRTSAYLLILALLVPMPAFAVGEGRINGTVIDASGAPVAGAKVVLVREGTKLKQQKETSEKGAFNMLVLDATVSYRILIEKEHFLPLDEPIKPVPGDTLRVSYTLKPLPDSQ
jgi:hypothetical protein